MPHFRIFWVLDDGTDQQADKPFYEGDHDKPTLAVTQALEFMTERLGRAWSCRPNEFVVEDEEGHKLSVETWPVYQVSFHMAVYDEPEKPTE